MVFRKQGQNLLGVETVKVVDEDGCLTQPLTVELAPQGLCPAGIGNGQVQTVGIHLMPVFCGDKVTQWVLVVVGGQLGIAGGAGGEEHQHGIAAAGRVLGSGEAAAEHAVLFIEIPPAFPASANQNPDRQLRALLCRFVHGIGGLAVGGAQDCLDICRLEAVGKVLGLELIGGRDDHSPQLVQTQDGEPELIVAL